MSRVLILGGGLIGLSTALMLTRQGHDVTVFERDADPPPDSPEVAWDTWERGGVAQFRMPHYLQPAGRHLLDSHLPAVSEALLATGCVTFDTLTLMPPSIIDRARREGDERFATITGRRSTIEYAVAHAAEKQVSLCRGVSIVGLLAGRSAGKGIPHVAGVRTSAGDQVFGDLVTDATGRRSRLPDWLEALGARRPTEEAEDSGFTYYTRYFRSASGAMPPYRTGLLTDFHSFSLLILPGDAHTWSVTVYISSDDQLLKPLRDRERWTTLVAACPLHAHWLDGEPITDVLAMAGIIDRYRRFVVDGAPVATGILAVGDAWACTNPSLGRGIAMGLMHAAGTAEVVRQHLDDPLTLALAHDAMTEHSVTPWYRCTIEMDRAHIALMKASIEGQPLLQPADPAARLQGALLVAMMYDADLFRAFLEIIALLALPQEVQARPGVAERAMEIADSREPVTPPCPSREEVLHMLA